MMGMGMGLCFCIMVFMCVDLSMGENLKGDIGDMGIFFGVLVF